MLKQLILFSLCQFQILAFANDQMIPEIICKKILAPGEADNDLKVTLLSNPTVWKKLLEIEENGFLGPRVIAKVVVPREPELVGLDRGGEYGRVNMIYRGKTAELTITAYDHSPEPLPLTGEGSIKLNLPEYPPVTVELHCHYND